MNNQKCKYCGKETTRKNAVYCNMKCYKSDPQGKQKISDIKTKLYQDPEWKAATELKKTSTCRKNFGCDYPMQNIESFEKHERNSLQGKKYKGFTSIRGYEPLMIDYLINKNFKEHHHFITGTSALKLYEMQIIDNTSRRYPDLFLAPFAMFIEVKSDYTFLKDIDKIKNIKNILESKGFDYEVIKFTDKTKTPMAYDFDNRSFYKADVLFNTCFVRSIK